MALAGSCFVSMIMMVPLEAEVVNTQYSDAFCHFLVHAELNNTLLPPVTSKPHPCSSRSNTYRNECDPHSRSSGAKPKNFKHSFLRQPLNVLTLSVHVYCLWPRSQAPPPYFSSLRTHGGAWERVYASCISVHQQEVALFVYSLVLVRLFSFSTPYLI